MLYYRFHSFPVAADAPLGTTIARVNECLSKDGVANTPLRFCFFGERACSAIAAKFPELAYFLTDQGSPQDEAPRQHLSNFGLSAPGALAGPAGEVPFETIAAVVEGIPAEFPIYLVMVTLGPIVQGRTFVPTPSARSPLLVLLNSQCVSLHWQDSPTREGEKYSLSVIEPLPTADPNQPVPDWIRALYSGFPGAAAEKISSEIDWIAMDYGTVVRSEGSPSVKSKSIPDELNLPYKLPDAKAASELKHAPLKGVREIIARVFVDDGWKQLPDGEQAGVYVLRKSSARGRPLTLTFRIQKPRGSSRNILGHCSSFTTAERRVWRFTQSEAFDASTRFRIHACYAKSSTTCELS